MNPTLSRHALLHCLSASIRIHFLIRIFWILQQLFWRIEFLKRQTLSRYNLPISRKFLPRVNGKNAIAEIIGHAFFCTSLMYVSFLTFHQCLCFFEHRCIDTRDVLVLVELNKILCKIMIIRVYLKCCSMGLMLCKWIGCHVVPYYECHEHSHINSSWPISI